MALYYFHLKDGATILDSEGCELPDLTAVRRAAIATTTDVLGGMKGGPAFWSGEPWKLSRWAKRGRGDLADPAIRGDRS
jgi:hypothetical protein